MRKVDLVSQLAERTGATKREAERHLDALRDTIFEALEDGDDVTLPDVGRFETKVSAARTVNNQAGTFEVPKRIAPRFKPSAVLKRALAEQPV